MNELALFAGAGGGILGGILNGWKTVCAVEINEYCRRVLMQRQDDGILEPFPIWPDIRTFDGRPWAGCVDIVTGGFPCQAWSTAARGRNTAQNMWPEMLRIIGQVSPRYVFAENVDEGAIAAAQHDLAKAGFTTVRANIAANQLGADHIRDRWWLLADANHKGKLGGKVDAEMAFFEACDNGLWKTAPDISRMANGVANRVDRLKAIGNGQVSAVVRLAYSLLK